MLNTRHVNSIQDDYNAFKMRLKAKDANPNVTSRLGQRLRSGAETDQEVAMQSLDATCSISVESTVPDEQSDGIEHYSESIRLRLIRPEWTALHVASARAQHDRVQLLIAEGADVNAVDSLCRTPLDVAGLEYYMGHMTDVNSVMQTVDLLLKAGGKFHKRCSYSGLDTPLHTAVELGSSRAAVEQMLQGGASATAWNSRGLTAMHLCVEKRNEILLQLLASHTSSNEDSVSIDVADGHDCTVLCAAVKADWLPGVSIVLGTGATNTKATSCFNGELLSDVESTVFHLAAGLGRTDVLKHLLDFYNQDERKEIVNKFDAWGLPIYYAVHFNHADCVSLLISKGTLIDKLEPGSYGSTLLRKAVFNRNTKIAKLILQQVNAAVISHEPSLFYKACANGDKKMIALLLQYGAELTENTHDPLQMLMKNVSKPTEFMQEVFDSNISFELHEDTVSVDFQVLLPRNGRNKMKVIQALLDSGNAYNQHSLLLHPLVESFLYLQWRSLLPFFYFILALHVCFVFSLNVFVLSLFWYKDRQIEPVPILFRSSAWIVVIYVTAVLLSIQNFFIKKKTIRDLISLEMLVKCLSTIFALAIPLIMSWDSKSYPEWVRLFGSATLLLTWVRMMYQLSRLPDWGYYILMYGKVAIKVFKILVSFGLLIFGFCVSFMIQFHAQPPFEDPLSSLFTTMVMMLSEFAYTEIMNKKSVEDAAASLIMMRLIFGLFLISVSIILMNLLIAVAVDDVKTLENIGNINRLKKQVQFIKSFEDTSDNRFIKKILFTSTSCGMRLYKTPSKLTILRNFRRISSGLPTRLSEALFEIAQLRKRQSDEKQGSKLDEIHQIIVHKDSCVLAKPDIPDITMNQLLEEIIKLRSDYQTDMKQIKNLIVLNNRCPRCSNHRKVEK